MWEGGALRPGPHQVTWEPKPKWLRWPRNQWFDQEYQGPNKENQKVLEYEENARGTYLCTGLSIYVRFCDLCIERLGRQEFI